MAFLSSQIQPPQYLMPAKFLLIMSQVLLLTLVLYLRTDHIYWGVGEQSFSTQSDQYFKAESTLVGVTICFLIFLAFEFLIMILGISLTFNQVNLIQIFLHSLGCIFTLWFLLDSWNFKSMWPIWGLFGLTPFLCEIFTLSGAAIFNANVTKNRQGLFKQ